MKLDQISAAPTRPLAGDQVDLCELRPIEGKDTPGLVRVSDLTVELNRGEAKQNRILDGIPLEILKGQAIGILGESGCGKTTLARTLLRLLPDNFRVSGGAVDYRGVDVLRMSSGELRKMRGAAISLIHQEPAGALHPTMRIGHQVAEVLRAHNQWSRRKSRQNALAILRRVFPGNTNRIFNSYPHELSGGQRQRVSIAQAISCQPALIIADEPTASLDLTTQVEVIRLLKDLRQSLGMALVFITHNPFLLPGLVDRVVVMYAGQIVEEGSTSEVLTSPLHPYTQELLRLRPGHDREETQCNGHIQPMVTSAKPFNSGPGVGCHYDDRCSQRLSKCTTEMPVEKHLEESRRIRCFLYEQ